jgi:hypothetical protein
MLNNWWIAPLAFFLSAESKKLTNIMQTEMTDGSCWLKEYCNMVTLRHYGIDNNRDRSHIAVRPVYSFLEYLFFIRLCSYHMLLLSCRLHNWQPRRLARVAMRKSVRNLIFIAVTHPNTVLLLLSTKVTMALFVSSNCEQSNWRSYSRELWQKLFPTGFTNLSSSGVPFC